MIEGAGFGSGSGSIPLTNGSGYMRPKNMWIRWIRMRWIRIRIRIRNTDFYNILLSLYLPHLWWHVRGGAAHGPGRFGAKNVVFA
jgi:hypothetical protein